jgi:hypothetical protein
MNFIINNLYYKIYMSDYYKKNREIIIQRNMNYYFSHKEKVRQKQNKYFKTVYYPFKRFNVKHRVPPNREVKIETNVTVYF